MNQWRSLHIYIYIYVRFVQRKNESIENDGQFRVGMHANMENSRGIFVVQANVLPMLH